ncbi:hypothetical protein [Coleofasciculus sp. G1-WW12-02]|uniref:hypothetical protein n=1 Tax=Coleofasciculus sp. G1-WW12-02 TaxID=3068483 RepID=UPI004062C220
MHSLEIKAQLKSLMKEASSIEPCLAKRLDEINRWVKDIKPGSLTAKKFVMAFLLEVIQDAKVWLAIKALSSPELQESAFEQMTPTERYWYHYLFPKWLNSNDPKFYIWKQKLMSSELTQADDDILKSIAQTIVSRGGTVWRCYITDFSMATDLIVSYRQRKPLCLQVTSVSNDYSQEKYENWQNTLQMWVIDRGLFLSYNPGKPDFLDQLVTITLHNSDFLPLGRYLKFS